MVTSRYAKTTNGPIGGLLYVPQLPTDHPCVEKSAPHVPDNAVRRSDLPPTNYNLIALVPWVTNDCTRKYLSVARKDPVRGMILYGLGNSTDHPPTADSSEWDLGDGGRWKNANYPIFAVSAAVGSNLMHRLSLYSGNLTEVPYGLNISDNFDPDINDYVRIWTEVSVVTITDTRQIGLFVLGIIALLLVIVVGISLLMHAVQWRRRVSLRRRVISGEVNLERMGIKRLTVPIEHVQTFPLYTYHFHPANSSPPISPRSTRPPKTKRGNRGKHPESSRTVSLPAIPATISEDLNESNSRAAITRTSTAATDHQPNCEICLEPFKDRVTIIRELPCGHIFHPDCIDGFLSEMSSLCPLCKASMLPDGYYPKITNATVRRERAVRRLRSQIVVEDYDEDGDGDEKKPEGKLRAWAGTMKRVFSIDPSVSPPAAPFETGLRQNQQLQFTGEGEEELRVVADDDGNRNDRQHRRSNDPEAPDSDREGPTELARQRMRELAGSVPPDDGDAQLTKCLFCSQYHMATEHITNYETGRRIRIKVFPGF